MKRRAFIQSAMASGLVLNFGQMSAQAAPLANRYFVIVNASGAWDTTSFCDPKGSETLYSDDKGAVNKFSENDIQQIGAFNVAPTLPNLTTPPETNHVEAFFTQFKDELLVINGVDQGTNNHKVGKRLSGCGSSNAVFPSTMALIAEPFAQSQPMPYLTYGDYDNTDSLLASTRLSNLSVINELVNDNPYMESQAADILGSFLESRMDHLGNQVEYQNKQNLLEQLSQARNSKGDLGKLLDAMPATPDSGLRLQAEVVAASFGSGLSTVANMRLGGFDSHNDNDQRQSDKLNEYFDGVSYLISELKRQGVYEQTTIIMASDFARTPYYNSNNGKDHWPVNSFLFLGSGINGGRTIGATDYQQKPLLVNPETLAIDNENGIKLTPAHIHIALRKLAGLEGQRVDNDYILEGEWIDLFS